MKIKYMPLLLILLAGCGEKAADPNSEAAPVTAASVSASVQTVVGIGRVEPEAKMLDIKPEMTGRLVNILVKAGDKVKVGDLLFELDHSENDARLSQVQARMRTADAQVQQLRKGIQIAGINQDLAQKEYNRYQAAFEGKAETKSTLDKAENNLSLSKEQVKQQELQLRTAQATRNELNAEQAVLLSQAENTQIRALEAGTLLSIELPVGSMVNSNSLLAQFAPESPLSVVTEVDELFANKVKVGQKADVRLQGTTEVIANAEVIFAAPFLRQKSLFSDEVGKLEDRRVREVRVRITDPKADLLYGSRVECVIHLK